MEQNDGTVPAEEQFVSSILNCSSSNGLNIIGGYFWIRKNTMQFLKVWIGQLFSELFAHCMSIGT